MFTKKKTVETTAFSLFIREAPAKEKKRVYSDVLRKAIDRQRATIRRAEAAQHP